MSSPIGISDDDDSFDQLDQADLQDERDTEETIEILSSDSNTIPYLTSDDEEALPAVELKAKKSAVIKNLFPTKAETSTINKYFQNKPSTSKNSSSKHVATSSRAPEMPKPPGFEKMIGGVKVVLPVEPYGSQTALMFKVITAINKGQNCLLESPTGSGKTLALLCGALAWQQQERNRIAQSEAQTALWQHPELGNVNGAAEYISSPPRPNMSPEKLFGKTVFGERSIYDKPVANTSNGDGASISKRQEPLQDLDCCAGVEYCGQVSIHKKRRLNGEGYSTSLPTTPEKGQDEDLPQEAKHLCRLIESLHLRTSMVVDCRLPTIYYGARTHKQLEQVIQEFCRTAYCGDATMTVLSSREYSCIREFDKELWKTKNDMCRGCTKKSSTPKNKGETNCVYYNNRQALNHESLPPAFDLEDLVAAGHEKHACPYYAARAMAQKANIVFCPYNYLIEPSIRSSMQISLEDNIVIIDEAHNIEDICRDAASLTMTQDTVQTAILELERCTSYRYANQDAMHYLDYLLKSLKNWDQWFKNQQALVKNKAVNNNEAVHTWEVEHFAATLNNHNIGEVQYQAFKQAADVFCRRLREAPDTLYGVTQTTGSLVESLDIVLGYVFRENGRFKDDFKPAFIRTVRGSGDLSESRGWRNSQFNQWVEKETYSLKLICLNSAIIFSGLSNSRCVLLASGTLTPLLSLHSELGTSFPLQVSPNHVIPADRVWIGTLTTGPDGKPLECTSRGTSEPRTQAALGEAILWVCQVTPHGVLCFLPSYALMNRLVNTWQETGLWRKLNDVKHVFMESRNAKDHNDVMDDYYKYVATSKGALLFAVYRGKVSEGMDFKDHQARAVITIGVPYPSVFDMAVKEKMNYNDRYSEQRKLLSSQEWLRVQAYRALNQAVGRCVRHRADWGAVLLVDARFARPYYTEHLSKWVRNFLGNNHHTFESLVNSPNSLESFMQNMTIREREEDA